MPATVGRDDFKVHRDIKISVRQVTETEDGQPHKVKAVPSSFLQEEKKSDGSDNPPLQESVIN